MAKKVCSPTCKLIPLYLAYMKISFDLLLLTYVTTSTAQTAEDSVKAVINKMFTAMRTADGEMLAACFTDNAVLQTIANDKAGKSFVRTDSPAGFVTQIKNCRKIRQMKESFLI
jgi:exopolysaccharide biosynthesis protein